MRRQLMCLGLAAVVGAFIGLFSPDATAQSGAPARAAKAWTMARTPDGHPDLQGNWNLATLTPLERPDAATGQTISDDEATKLEKNEKEFTDQRAQPSRGDRSAPPAGANVGGYNFFWIDRGSSVITINGQRRSSLLIDPADGKIPKVTAEAQRRNATPPGAVAWPTA